MKKLIATIGWLLMASASMGEAGQHTGVGGNPWVPPPSPDGFVAPIIVMQNIALPGVLIVIPGQEQPADQNSGSGENAQDNEGEGSEENK